MLVSIRLYAQGENLNPTQITELLRIQPSRSHLRGEPRNLPGGRTAHERIGVWVWKTGVDRPDARLEDCLNNFLLIFQPVAARLKSLPNAETCWIDVHAVKERSADSDGSEVTLLITPEHAQALGMLGLPVEITVSTVDPDQQGADEGAGGVSSET